MKKNNIINNWMNAQSDPEIEKFVVKNMAIVEKVRLDLEAKGWSKVQLAKAMGKSPSEVSKWLTGMHNLTLKSIVKMESALGIDLIHCEPIKEYEYVFLGTVENNEDLKTKADEYTESYPSQEYSFAI